VVIRRSKRVALNFFFWLAFIGVVLIEPATKFAAQYHFAVMLPGFAGICALSLREAAHEWPNFNWINKERRDAIALLGVMLSVLWFSLGFSALARNFWPATQEMLVAPDEGWPEIFAENPFLIAAEIIKEVIPENGTLSVNRNMHVLHPLTGYLPPSDQLVNLSSLVLRSDFSVSRIKEALMNCAPDVMLLSLQDDWLTGNSNSELLTAIRKAGIYEMVIEISVVDRTMDASIVWTIYRKTKETTCLVS
jgi:hypothetical protein